MIGAVSSQNINNIYIIGNIGGIKKWPLPQYIKIKIVGILHTIRRGIKKNLPIGIVCIS